MMYVFCDCDTSAMAVFTNLEQVNQFEKSYRRWCDDNDYSCRKGLDYNIELVRVNPNFDDWIKETEY